VIGVWYIVKQIGRHWRLIIPNADKPTEKAMRGRILARPFSVGSPGWFCIGYIS